VVNPESRPPETPVVADVCLRHRRISDEEKQLVVPSSRRAEQKRRPRSLSRSADGALHEATDCN